MLAFVGILDGHGALVEAAESQGPDVDAPLPVVELHQPDPVAAERLPHIDPGAVPVDAAVVTGPPHLVVPGVLERGEAGGVGPGLTVSRANACR